MKKRVGIVSLLLLFPVMMHGVSLKIISATDIANTFTISQSGLYVLGSESACPTGIALSITTSDVTLDLSNRALRGTGATAGISIADGTSNITIKNGNVIGDFSTYGIFIGSGVQNIKFESLVVSGTSNDSTSLHGVHFASGTPQTSHAIINNCLINNTNTGLVADKVDDLFIDHASINNNGTGISITNCNSCYMNNCRISDNTTNSSGTSFGLSIDQSSYWSIKNSDFSFNQNSVRGTGVYITNSTTIVILDSTFFDNGSTGAASSGSEGLHLESSTSCLIKNCTANGNFAETGTGAGIRMSGASSNSHFLDQCVANGNVTITATVNAYGIMIDEDVSNINISECTSGTNKSNGALGAGFFVASSATNILIRSCSGFFNSHFGAIINSATAYLLDNSFIGHPSSLTGQGQFDTINVSNGAQPPAGTFDSRAVSNLTITSIVA